MSTPFRPNRPTHWELDASGCLRIFPEPNTDFWQRTHYGFRADNGHFLFAEQRADFVLSAHISLHPLHQYDQAGLMVRLSEDCWLKTSVEHEPEGPSWLGAVVTNQGYSDWSTQPFPDGLNEVWLRVSRHQGDYLIEHGNDGQTWNQLRLTHLLEDSNDALIQCGIYACSPKAAGFMAEFEHVVLR